MNDFTDNESDALTPLRMQTSSMEEKRNWTKKSNNISAVVSVDLSLAAAVRYVRGQAELLPY